MSTPLASTAGAPAGAGRISIHGSRLPDHAPAAVLATTAGLVALLRALTEVHLALLAIGGALLAALVVVGWSAGIEGRRKATDRAVTFTVGYAFALALWPLLSLLLTVLGRGTERFDIAFFTETARNVVGAGGGAQHAITGTLLITGLAALASVPIGVLTAIYLNEYGKGRLKRAITFFVDVMTGIPSIVAGLFAYALFALVFGPGIRLGVMGSVALAVLMIPIVVRSTEEMLRIVPNGLRESAFALGVPKWRVVLKVVLPTALGGIVTGVMLAIARVIGETAPLLVTTGVLSSLNTNPFSGRMENLAVYAFNQYKNPGVPKDPYIDRAWAAALTLIVIVLLLTVVARLVQRRYAAVTR